MEYNPEYVSRHVSSLILPIIRCVRCKRVIFPPIYICMKLHICCIKCRAIGGNCPVSDCKQEVRINTVLLDLTRAIIYPCPGNCGGWYSAYELDQTHECEHIAEAMAL